MENLLAGGTPSAVEMGSFLLSRAGVIRKRLVLDSLGCVDGSVNTKVEMTLKEYNIVAIVSQLLKRNCN